MFATVCSPQVVLADGPCVGALVRLFAHTQSDDVVRASFFSFGGGVAQVVSQAYSSIALLVGLYVRGAHLMQPLLTF